MSTHKHIDKICLVAALLAIVLCALFMNAEALGVQQASKVMGYENRLFDTSQVHAIDILIDDWDGFLETARSEEYSVCSVIIDGEVVSNVGIRGKGNTSLSNVASMDSDRYSFKIEFDQYDSAKTYYGLDKLSLNNVIQDNTYMKDYLSYRMMNEFGVPAPLCSYAYITVNGEAWGLYLAVEAVEESFLQRNYGSNYGDLYKPDSMNMGGGRGNGKDFEMPDFSEQQERGDENAQQSEGNNRGGMPTPGNMPGGFGRGGSSLDEETIRKAFGDLEPDTSVLDGIDFDEITMDTLQTVSADLDSETMQKPMEAVMDSGEMQMPGMGGKGGSDGMGSSETKLQYIDDDPASYSTIFESAKTNVTDADQTRLIASLKRLSEYENLEEVLNIEDVLRYFVVHNYVVNGDSYTGSMIHNYYLYEEDGRLSMIPWDYNLAFGTFQGNNVTSAVNDDIDEVLSDRPMQAWIFSDETYSQQYYALYAELLEQVDVQGIIDHAYELIAPYVEKDPTAFCGYEEFRAGVEALKEFCVLRSESVRLQLSGSTEPVDAGGLNLSDMGTMGVRGYSEGTGRENRNEGSQWPEKEAMGGSAMPLAEGREHSWGTMRIPAGAEMPGNRIDRTGTTGDVTGKQNMPAGEGFGGSPALREGQDFGNTGSMGNKPADTQHGDQPQMTTVLLIASVLTLAVGLFIAGKFRH